MDVDLERLPVWQKMKPITLDEMDSIKLMNRVDTKYVTTLACLHSILDEAAADYRVLCVDGKPVSRYNTLYFDTDDLDMYTRHQTGHLVRQKVRTRTYIESGQSFLEIKRKNNKGRTKKKRISIPTAEVENFAADHEATEFLAEKSQYRVEQIEPALRTVFSRITLVNNEKTERLTIDTALAFRNPMTGYDIALPQLVIIELKQDGRCVSPIEEILREHHIHPFRISKYCVGTALTNPSARQNRIKRKLRAIERLTNKNDRL